MVKKSVDQTLRDNNLSFQPVSWKMQIGDSKITESFAGNLLREKSQEWDITYLGKNNARSQILQIFNTYIILETHTNIIIFDQHASHERILYEKFLKEFHEKKIKKQSHTLEESIQLNLSVPDAELLRVHMHQFTKLGFIIEEFYENMFKIVGVPFIFQDRNIQYLISELLDEILEKNVISNIDIFSSRMIAFLACRTAVMAGDKLSDEQMISLIKELKHTTNNMTCPHGRPTRIQMSSSNLNKIFKRE